MRKLLISASFVDNTGKYWREDLEKQTILLEGTIHDTVKKLLGEYGISISYKGKPQGNVYKKDDKDGTPIPIGYLYRVKIAIRDEDYKWHNVPFDACVRVHEVIDYPIDDLENI